MASDKTLLLDECLFFYCFESRHPFRYLGCLRALDLSIPQLCAETVVHENGGEPLPVVTAAPISDAGRSAMAQLVSYFPLWFSC